MQGDVPIFGDIRPPDPVWIIVILHNLPDMLTGKDAPLGAPIIAGDDESGYTMPIFDNPDIASARVNLERIQALSPDKPKAISLVPLSGAIAIARHGGASQLSWDRGDDLPQQNFEIKNVYGGPLS